MTQTHTQNLLVLILGLKDRYVNVPIGACQEKYPFLSERETENGSDKPEQMRTDSDIHHCYDNTKTHK